MESHEQYRRYNPFVSVIIPTLNEGESLPDLLHYLFHEVASSSIEVIVVDGQSTDETAEVARKAGARVIMAARVGRGPQMNEGARFARGRVLYFLHSDTYPPPHFSQYIKEAVQEGYGAGCFQLGFDQDRRLLRFYSWFTQFDINAFRFGDQSLFVTSALFQKINGFDEDLKLMEDNEIIHRLKEKTRFKIMPRQVTTSARRYREKGVLRLQLFFILIYTLYHLGVSQDILVDIYRQWIQ